MQIEAIFNTRVVSNFQWSRTPVTNALQLVLGPEFNDLLDPVRDRRSPWDEFTVKTLASLKARALLRRGAQGCALSDTNDLRESLDHSPTFNELHSAADSPQRHETESQNVRDVPYFVQSDLRSQEEERAQTAISPSARSDTEVLQEVENESWQSHKRKNIRNRKQAKRDSPYILLSGQGSQTRLALMSNHNGEFGIATPRICNRQGHDSIPALTDDDDTVSMRSDSPSPEPCRAPQNTPVRLGQAHTRTLSEMTDEKANNPTRLAVQARSASSRKLSPDPAPFYPASVRRSYETAQHDQSKTMPPRSIERKNMSAIESTESLLSHEPWSSLQTEAQLRASYAETLSMYEMYEDQVRVNAAAEEVMPRKAILADFLHF